MKTISLLPRVILCALALGAVTVTPTFAEPPAAAQAKGARASVLTPEEKAEFDKARDAALAANPDLKTASDKVKADREALKAKGPAVAKEDRKALKSAAHDLDEKLRPAMLKIDPNLGPIFTKLDAARDARKASAAADASKS